MMDAEISGLLRKFRSTRNSAVSIAPDRELVKAVLGEYNSAIAQLMGIKDGLKLPYLQLRPIYANEIDLLPLSAAATLERIETECEEIICVLERLATPLPEGELDKLYFLRKESEKLSIDLSDIYFEKNVEEEIKECEHGHFLASALISSRVAASF